MVLEDEIEVGMMVVIDMKGILNVRSKGMVGSEE